MSTVRFRYDASSKMSDMITTHPLLMTLLPRFGLSLGFGDKSVGDVCAVAGVDTDLFVLTCSIYATGGIVPAREHVLATSMKQLVPYLQRSHDLYLNKRLPHIAGHMKQIAERLPERAGTALLQFFDDYCNEMREHFAHEELTVFPYITALQQGLDTHDYSIDTFLVNHGNIEAKFEDLLQIIFKYLPHEVADADDDMVNLVYDILLLAGDLHCHAVVEEQVMVPYVKQLEQEVKQ